MKKVLAVHNAPPRHWVGDGFPVRSLFSYNGLGLQLSPFLMLDHAAPTHFEPAPRPRGASVAPAVVRVEAGGVADAVAGVPTPDQELGRLARLGSGRGLLAGGLRLCRKPNCGFKCERSN